MTESPILAASRRVDALEAADHTDAVLGAVAINATLVAMGALYGRTRFLPGDFRTSRAMLKALINLPPASIEDDVVNPAPQAGSVPSDILDKMEEALKGASDQIPGERAA